MKKITLLLITILCSTTIRAQDVSTLAGSLTGFLNGTGTSAKFYRPAGVCSDGAGNLYVADAENHKIRKIVLATGVVSTLAGSTAGFLNDTGTSAKFNSPKGVCSDGAGNIYVTDTNNHKIRKIVIATGVVSTLAGSTAGFFNDTGTSAKFNTPYGLCSDGAGNIYVADSYNNKVRKIVIATGATSTLAGSVLGFLNGVGTSAKFNIPLAICTDGTGNLYVADTYNHKIRKIVIATGATSTLTGTSSGFFNGEAISAQFKFPNGLCTDGSGNLYVADIQNNKIRKIVIATGVTSTLAGSTAGFNNATGGLAQFNNPYGICKDSSGNLYIADYSNDLIRKISNVSLSIQKNNFSTKLSIYPNPSIGETKIQLGATYDEIDVQIFDVFGKQISTLKHNNTNEISLNTQQFSPGVYVIKVQANAKQASLKLVVK